ncbi:hypothetical protein HYV50_05670 [Candidatus Pacearchaeota archaeon]|nr:hypothetical protein [Candidatus Pacearchaeota archaeon]
MMIKKRMFFIIFLFAFFILLIEGASARNVRVNVTDVVSGRIQPVGGATVEFWNNDNNVNIQNTDANGLTNYVNLIAGQSYTFIIRKRAFDGAYQTRTISGITIPTVGTTSLTYSYTLSAGCFDTDNDAPGFQNNEVNISGWGVYGRDVQPDSCPVVGGTQIVEYYCSINLATREIISAACLGNTSCWSDSSTPAFCRQRCTDTNGGSYTTGGTVTWQPWFGGPIQTLTDACGTGIRDITVYSCLNTFDVATTVTTCSTDQRCDNGRCVTATPTCTDPDDSGSTITNGEDSLKIPGRAEQRQDGVLVRSPEDRCFGSNTVNEAYCTLNNEATIGPGDCPSSHPYCIENTATFWRSIGFTSTVGNWGSIPVAACVQCPTPGQTTGCNPGNICSSTYGCQVISACTSDADCNDNIECTQDRCRTSDGTCSHPFQPARTSCTEQPFGMCNEVNEWCSECVDNSDCTGGKICDKPNNGRWTCVAPGSTSCPGEFGCTASQFGTSYCDSNNINRTCGNNALWDMDGDGNLDPAGGCLGYAITPGGTCAPAPGCTDNDGDSYGTNCPAGDDCDDTDPTKNIDCGGGPTEFCDPIENPDAFTATNCGDYNSVGNNNFKQQACENDCSGAGSGGETCYWENGQCKGLTTTSSGLQCRIEYLSNPICAEGQTTRQVTIRSTKISGPPGEECEGETTKQIPCPKVIQLPFFNFANFIIALIVIFAIYYLHHIYHNKNNLRESHKEKKKRSRKTSFL